MIVWMNGTFGVGKTTTATCLADQAGWRVFDPEHVGFLLSGTLRDLEFSDFQDLPPWRALVPAFADEVFRFTKPAAMIAVQTVLVEEYWLELVDGLADRDLEVFHVVLRCDEAELRRRIESDEVERQALQWRLDHVERFEAAMSWLGETADLVMDTTGVEAANVARRIEEAVGRARTS